MTSNESSGDSTPTPDDEQQLFVGPFFPWYPADWQGSRNVRRLSLAARGLYREMLDICWEEGFAPDDMGAVAELAGIAMRDADAMATAWQEVRPLFTACHGKLTCQKVESVRGRAKNRNLTRNGRRNDAGTTSKRTPPKPKPKPKPRDSHSENPELAPKRRRARLDGAAELEKAFAALPGSMQTTELRDACEAYRAERSERRFPTLSASKWSAHFEKARGDAVCAAVAFRASTTNSYRGVFPKPTQGRTGGLRPKQDIELLDRVINAPRTINTHANKR